MPKAGRVNGLTHNGPRTKESERSHALTRITTPQKESKTSAAAGGSFPPDLVLSGVRLSLCWLSEVASEELSDLAEKRAAFIERLSIAGGFVAVE